MRHTICFVIPVLFMFGCKLPKQVANSHNSNPPDLTAQALNSTPRGALIVVARNMDSDGYGYVIAKDTSAGLHTFQCTPRNESLALCQVSPVGTDLHNLPVK